MRLGTSDNYGRVFEKTGESSVRSQRMYPTALNTRRTQATANEGKISLLVLSAAAADHIRSSRQLRHGQPRKEGLCLPEQQG